MQPSRSRHCLSVFLRARKVHHPALVRCCRCMRSTSRPDLTHVQQAPHVLRQQTISSSPMGANLKNESPYQPSHSHDVRWRFTVAKLHLSCLGPRAWNRPGRERSGQVAISVGSKASRALRALERTRAVQTWLASIARSRTAVSALSDAADLAIEQILRGSSCQPSSIRQPRTIHLYMWAPGFGTTATNARCSGWQP